jgi:hypothetical protein
MQCTGLDTLLCPKLSAKENALLQQFAGQLRLYFNIIQRQDHVALMPLGHVPPYYSINVGGNKPFQNFHSPHNLDRLTELLHAAVPKISVPLRVVEF